MIIDGYIDDDEITVLIDDLSELQSKTIILKEIDNNESDKIIINNIIESIEQEKEKMVRINSDINETKQGLGM